PKVTMNELMPNRTIKKALSAPTATAKPTATRQASAGSKPIVVVKYATALAAMPITDATDKSNSPTNITIVTPMASITSADCVLNMVVKLPKVKKVPGRSPENKAMMSASAINNA